MSGRRRTVLLVGNFLSSSQGARGVGADLAPRLQEAGWQVTTTSGRSGRLARLLDMLGTVWRRRSDFDIAQIDLFSGLSFVWGEAVAAMLGILGKPYVLTLHGGALPAFAERWPRRVERLFSSAASITSPSPYLADRMKRFYHRILVIPNGIDISRYEFRPRQHPQPRLIWLRAFHEVYRPWLALRVMSTVRETYPGTSLVMMGPDKRDGSLERAISERRHLALGEAVEFVGPVAKSEVPQRLQSGDVFLNTAVVDNAPVTVIEAMACGLCVVSTDVGGVPFLLDDGEEGLLVPPDDQEAMANAVVRILGDAKLAESLSRNGRRKAECHDWSIVIPRWEQLFQEVVKDG